MKTTEPIEVFGAIPSPVDVRDYKLTVANARELPESFSLQMVRVKDQKSVGSCVAHAGSEVVEFHNHRQRKDRAQMSTGFIYGNRTRSTYHGTGMITRDMLKSLVEDGTSYYFDFPENIEMPQAEQLFLKRIDELEDNAYQHRISAYVSLSGEHETKCALMDCGPVVCVTKWYPNSLDKDYVLHFDTSKSSSGSHAMVIYGWNEHGWLVQNSWGSGWGNGGTCIIPFDHKFTELWAVTDEINDNIKKPLHSRFGRLFAKIINTVANFFIQLWRYFVN